jgi:hypothetical protein
MRVLWLLLLLLLPVVRLLWGHVLPGLLRLLIKGLPIALLLLLQPWREELLVLLLLLVVTWRAKWLLMPPAAIELVRLLLLVLRVGVLCILLLVSHFLLRRSVLRCCIPRGSTPIIRGKMVTAS